MTVADAFWSGAVFGSAVGTLVTMLSMAGLVYWQTRYR